MSDGQRRVELVAAGMGDWMSGDREAAIESFAEDIEVYVPPELGNAGTYRGIDEFRSWFAAWDEVWTDYKMEMRAIEPVGERHVVAEVDNTGVGVGSGIEIGNTLGWVFSVDEDNRLDYLSLMPDLDAARDHARSAGVPGSSAPAGSTPRCREAHRAPSAGS
jgi:ketosteroid isomerase-like protein